MIRKLSMTLLAFSFVFVFALFVIATETKAQEPNTDNGQQVAGQQAKDEELIEPIPDNDTAKPLPGKIIFLNFATGAVVYVKDGTTLSYNKASILHTRRGLGKAFAAGFSFGLLGFATLPAIYAANTNGLKPDEIYDLIGFFPDGESFFLTSPFSQKSFQYDFNKKKLHKYRFGGCDPEILPDGKTIFIAPLAHDNKGKIASYDLHTGKKLDFSIEGKERQWWPRHSSDTKSMVFLEGPFDASDMVLYNTETKERKLLVPRESKPVHPCWSPDGSFIVYASLKDRQLHKINVSKGDDLILTSSPYFKPYPVVGKDNKTILFSQARLDVRSGSVGGRFIMKWLSLESQEIFTVPLNDTPKYFSAAEIHWWVP